MGTPSRYRRSLQTVVDDDLYLWVQARARDAHTSMGKVIERVLLAARQQSDQAPPRARWPVSKASWAERGPESSPVDADRRDLP